MDISSRIVIPVIDSYTRGMARPLRIEFAGALYHITSRGDRREAIFEDDEDREAFLRMLGEVVKRYNWICHAFCLMTNHYHLVMEMAEGNLSRGLRRKPRYRATRYPFPGTAQAARTGARRYRGKTSRPQRRHRGRQWDRRIQLQEDCEAFRHTLGDGGSRCAQGDAIKREPSIFVRAARTPLRIAKRRH
jgi:REP element-mobilizing transposase RayT